MQASISRSSPESFNIIMTGPPRTLVTGRNIPRDLLRENGPPAACVHRRQMLSSSIRGLEKRAARSTFHLLPLLLTRKYREPVIAAISQAFLATRKGNPHLRCIQRFLEELMAPLVARISFFFVPLSYTDTLEFSYPPRLRYLCHSFPFLLPLAFPLLPLPLRLRRLLRLFTNFPFVRFFSFG